MAGEISFKKKLISVPGHGLLLQDWVSLLFPTQSAPPPDGGGLLQVRLRICCPPPHVTLQASQTPQSDQPPSTVKYQLVKRRLKNHWPIGMICCVASDLNNLNV